MVCVHLVEMAEEGLLELLFGHRLHAGESMFEKADRVAAEPRRRVDTRLGPNEHQLGAEPLRLPSGDDSVMVEIERLKKLLSAFARLLPREIGLLNGPAGGL